MESKITKEQRRFLLMEQLKSIKKELGLERDDKSALLQKFTERWEPKKGAAPEEARRVVEEELSKLGGLEPVSPEFNVTRNYLEWLTALPWGQYSEEIFDITHAKQVRDAWGSSLGRQVWGDLSGGQAALPLSKQLTPPPLEDHLGQQTSSPLSFHALLPPPQSPTIHHPPTHTCPQTCLHTSRCWMRTTMAWRMSRTASSSSSRSAD